MQIKKVAETKLPTPWGEFMMIGFKELKSGKDHLALILGDIKKEKSVLSRIHSECLTGDALFSLRCDCGFQLKYAFKKFKKEGSGVLLYHRQEGRNIGLLNKIKAYSLQDKGLDTVEANHKLGFADDERDFSLCADMFKLINVYKIRLLTNNPKKIKILIKYGITVTERLPLVTGLNSKNKKYLKIKKKKMGHLFK
ncbi:MAG: GTP cyclohydrolase II [Enterobacteriaceae bacterium PSpicST2]|nr:MAG: GTP cyclohydrolase II [Enterobacteriaceae bacterium PSpicST2]WMC19133.1 MAG: GTP cyclohydrolase II [Enterobacteriaceae bacterium PSpicST1]